MQVGIDIGTHIARAALLDPTGQPHLVLMPDGSDALPALAHQTMHGLAVGADAAQARVGNAETTLVGCIRLMGRAGALPPQLLQRLPYTVREEGGEAICNLLYAEVRASEVYGALVKALVDAAARQAGTPITEVVLTVPASAEDRFRIQARAAVEAQGLTVRRLLNQPTAALLAATLPPSAQRVAVVYCGGGSTDVSIASVTPNANGAPRTVRILATAGDMLLGGDDLAWTMAEMLNERFRQTAGVNVFTVDESRVAAQGLRTAAEDALQRLCVAPETLLTLDHGGGFGRDLVTLVRRTDMDAGLAPLMSRLNDLCRRALATSHLKPKHIDAVVMTGEWAHLPPILETVAAAFAKPVAALTTNRASLLPVYGAALASAAERHTLWDVTPYPLGINCYYGDEELFSPIVAANTPIPTPAIGERGAATQSYQTRYPNQTSVQLQILQYRGDRDPNPNGAGRVTANECEVLGSWSFTDLRPRKDTCAAFTVTFAIDADGILQLQAEETRTGHRLSATVTRGIG